MFLLQRMAEAGSGVNRSECPNKVVSLIAGLRRLQPLPPHRLQYIIPGIRIKSCDFMPGTRSHQHPRMLGRYSLGEGIGMSVQTWFA